MPHRLNGLAYLFCGALTAVYWLLHPVAADPKAAHDDAFWAAMATGRYAVVNGLFVLVLLACMLGLNSLYARQADKVGTLGLVGYLLAFLGSGAFIGAGVFQAFVAPVLGADPATRALLDDKGPLLGQALAPVFAGAGFAFLIGYVLLMIATFRARQFPAVSAVLVALGAPILGLSPLMPLPARLIGCALFGVGTAWQGWVLFRGQATSVPS